MQFRRMGIIIGLALVVGSLISMVLPESESKIEETLFHEITYQMDELKRITDDLVQIRDTLAGMQQVQLDAQLQQTADWLFAFRPQGDSHEARKAYLIETRDQALQLVEELRTTRAALLGSNPSPAE